MKSFLYLGVIPILFSSCFDMSMKVEVDQKGAIQYEGQFDLSSMMPLMMMAMEMTPDTAGKEDPFSELLRSGEPVDTILSITELEEGLVVDDAIKAKLDEQFKFQMQIDQGNNLFDVNLFAKFDDISMQQQFVKMASESSSQEGGLIGNNGDSQEMFNTIFIHELNLDEGYIKFKTPFKESSGDEMDAMGSGGLFDGPTSPGVSMELTVPGKIKSIDGGEHTLLNDWTVLLKLPMETSDRSSEITTVHFEPKSVFTKPEVTEQWDPKPVKVSFAGRHNVPSDAIVLIGEDGPSGWEHGDGRDIGWTWEGDALTVKPGTGDIQTKEAFGDCQLHIEWRIPVERDRKGQGKGNSGIFLQSRYEVQVLDSYENSTYPNGQAGSIYKQSIPDVNATKAPGEWQTYDIIYRAPRFNRLGGKDESARITVIHNGVIIHNNREIKGTTEYIGLPKNPVHGFAPLKLQDHSNEVSYRNVWIRKM